MKDLSAGAFRRRHHRHHRHRRSGTRTKFLVFLLFAATAAVTWKFARQQPVSSLSPSSLEPTQVGLSGMEDKFAPASDFMSAFIASRPSRPVYLYSVIPGGVESVDELRQAVEHDPVAAKHFEGFDFQRAHLVTVSEKQSMHVAYRKGNKVYWTRKKVSLHPGETLISDGKIVARTRCGNRVAVAPLGPPAIVDPLVADFDQPLFSNQMVTHQAEPRAETYEASLASPLPEAANALQPTNKRKGLIPFFFLPLAGLPSGSSHQPLAVTPEPGTLVLISSGLAGVYLKSRKSRRER